MKKKRSGNDEKVQAETREQFFEESKFDPTNQKFGLFSYTGTLAVSKRPYFTNTKCHKNPDGTVTTAPSNFLVGGSKRGKTPDTYFSFPKYVPDNEGKEKRKKEKEKKIEINWKPGGTIPEKFSLYPHQPTENIKVINKRGPDGLVVLEPKNLYTSPPRLGSAMSTPGLLIGGQELPYQSEPYDRQHKMVQEEIKKSKEKMKSGPFQPPNPTRDTFFNNELTYGETNMPKKSIPRVRTQNILKHDRVFYPSNPSKFGSTIGKFPEFMPDPLSSPKRRPPSEQIAWRPTTKERSRPTPSVTNCVKNLRAEFPMLRKNH